MNDPYTIREGMNKAYDTVSTAIKSCVKWFYSLTPSYKAIRQRKGKDLLRLCRVLWGTNGLGFAMRPMVLLILVATSQYEVSM